MIPDISDTVSFLARYADGIGAEELTLTYLPCEPETIRLTLGRHSTAVNRKWLDQCIMSTPGSASATLDLGVASVVVPRKPILELLIRTYDYTSRAAVPSAAGSQPVSTPVRLAA